MTTNNERLQHELWLEEAANSEDPKTKELYRIHQHANLDAGQWLLIWWLGTHAISDPAYRMTGREIHFRIKQRAVHEELSRNLPPSWNGRRKFQAQVPTRKFVKATRKRLRDFYADGFKPNGLSVDLPILVSVEGSYKLVFCDESAGKPPFQMSVSVPPLRPSEMIWKRMISPIEPEKGMMIYSNEQPELGKAMEKAESYSGTGEVAAALLIGLRTAHLNCEIVPFRSKRFRLPEFRQLRTWFLFLGSPASNSAMHLVRDMPIWSSLQRFTFEIQADVSQPCKLKRNDDPEWSREHQPAIGHIAEQEFALITFLHRPKQVVVALSGITTVGTYAAARFLADDDKVEELLRKLEINPDDPIPSFEAVIKTSVYEGDDEYSSIEAIFRHPE